MSLVDAVRATGAVPPDSAPREKKKAYSEALSRQLAYEVADGLRQTGFPGVKPPRGGPGERQFQGGLGPKKVDVSYSDEQHGLKFEDVTTMIFQPLTERSDPWVKLIDVQTRNELTEVEYFSRLRQIYNDRNPHAIVEELADQE